MKFGVIYTADIYGEPFERVRTRIADVDPVRRLKQRGVWRKTETTKQRDTEGCVAHGKWCALLTKDQARQFLREFGFAYRTCCDTLGAIGMPGAEPWYACAPAWSFDSDAEDCLMNVYITPWPDIKCRSGVADREATWHRIKRAMRCLFAPWSR